MIKVRGFTLVEAIITVMILSIIAGLVISRAEIIRKRDKEHELLMALKTIRTAIDRYKELADEKMIMISDSNLESSYPHSLTDLVKGLQTRDHRVIYLLRSLPRDPFTKNMEELPENTWRIRSSQSEPGDFSEGSDVFDISSQSEEIGLNGIPYQEW